MAEQGIDFMAVGQDVEVVEPQGGEGGDEADDHVQNERDYDLGRTFKYHRDAAHHIKTKIRSLKAESKQIKGGIQEIVGEHESFLVGTRMFAEDVTEAIAAMRRSDAAGKADVIAEFENYKSEVEGFNEELCVMASDLLSAACDNTSAVNHQDFSINDVTVGLDGTEVEDQPPTLEPVVLVAAAAGDRNGNAGAVPKATPPRAERATAPLRPNVTLINLNDLKRDSECLICKACIHKTFFQCKDGHIVCSDCSETIRVCPMNCGYKYDGSNMIRCRLAERLADYYRTECPESP